MPSTYTQNTGIEKPAQGEQSGSWGTTVNTNMDIIDRAINGVTTIALTGTTSTITTNDGSTSDGQNKLLIFTGTLAAAHTVTIDPADAQKIYFIQNDTNQTLTFTQGTGAATAEVTADEFKIIYADGSDEVGSLVGGTLKVGGVAVTSSAAELNLLDDAVGGTVVNDKAVVYGSAGEVAATTMDADTVKADTVEFAANGWTIEQDSTGKLIFKYNGASRLSIAIDGAIVSEGDVTAFGSL